MSLKFYQLGKANAELNRLEHKAELLGIPLPTRRSVSGRWKFLSVRKCSEAIAAVERRIEGTQELAKLHGTTLPTVPPEIADPPKVVKAFHQNSMTCEAAIEELRDNLAALGMPQPELTDEQKRSLKNLNAEYARLLPLFENASKGKTIRSSISGAPGLISRSLPPVVAGHSGAPGSTLPSTPATVTGLSRYQLESALELFPAIEMSGAESDEQLAAMLKSASAEANIRLPGQPAEPTPGELRQKALNQILSSPSPVIASGSWNFESLSALVDATFGVGTARNETQVASLFDVSEGSHAAKINRHQPGTFAWCKAVDEAKRDARSSLSARHSAQEEQRQLDALRSFVCRSGLKVPGLSFGGLRIPDGAAEMLSPKQKAVAQARADAFCAVMAGDEEAGRSSDPAAGLARKFIAATNRQPFEIGMVPGQRPVKTTPILGPYGGIPKS